MRKSARFVPQFESVKDVEWALDMHQVAAVHQHDALGRGSAAEQSFPVSRGYDSVAVRKHCPDRALNPSPKLVRVVVHLIYRCLDNSSRIVLVAQCLDHRAP